MRESQQDIARRELAEMDVQMGRAPKAVTEADAPVERPHWLPPVHTHQQWRRHQEQTRLWEAQEAKRKAGLQESAATLTEGRVQLQESTTIAPTKASTGRLKVTLVTPGWGSSGHYSKAVLEAAGRDRIWPAGTQAFCDHPTQRELNERPERSVRDLAAVLVTDARWDGSALVAEAQLMPAWVETLGRPEMAAAIGMSIRASAEVEMGEAEGRRGRLVTKIIEGQSVDFVTRAGRGGSYQVVESWRSRWGA